MSAPAAFDDLIRSISELESVEFLEELGERMARTVDGLIERGFQSATAPDGTVWAPRRLAAGRTRPPHLPLRDSYRMHDGFVVEGSPAGVHVHNPVDYASYQNDGTTRLPPRRMVPGDDLGTWEEPLREAAMQVVASKLNEGG